jgi:hypothetical protein
MIQAGLVLTAKPQSSKENSGPFPEINRYEKEKGRSNN